MDDKVRDIMNKLRESANIAAGAAADAARQVSQKTGETIEVAKINMKIFDLNSEIGVSLREIGKLVYDTHTGKEVDESALENLLQDVDAKNVEVDTLKARLTEFKKALFCPKCGEICGKNDAFCKKCGAPLSL